MSQRQFNLSSLFGITALISCILALSVSPESIFAQIFWVVFAANAIGAVAGLLITFGWGFPRDGSYRFGNDDSEAD